MSTFFPSVPLPPLPGQPPRPTPPPTQLPRCTLRVKPFHTQRDAYTDFASPFRRRSLYWNHFHASSFPSEPPKASAGRTANHNRHPALRATSSVASSRSTRSTLSVAHTPTVLAKLPYPDPTSFFPLQQFYDTPCVPDFQMAAMSLYQQDPSFSQHSQSLSLLFPTEAEDVEAAGRPRRFPLCRGMRSDDPFAVQALTYEARVEESQESLERAVYGVMEEESDAAQVLVDMAKQEETTYDWMADSPLPSDIDAYIAEHPFTPCSPLPPSRLSLTTSSFLYGSQLDQQIASTWVDQSRAPPFTPLPAWATSSPSTQNDHKSDALDQLFSEYFDFSQLGESENTGQSCWTDGADQYGYDRNEFFESYTTPSPSPPVRTAQLEESTPYLQPSDLTHGLYTPAYPASALYGFAYAQPGFDSQRWQHYDQYQTPALSTPALTFDTGSTAYSTLPSSTPHSSSNAIQLPPYRVPAPVGGKRDLPFPPALSGMDLGDDPFYIGGPSGDSSGVGKRRATDRLAVYPSVVLGAEKGKGKGRAKATSLSPTTQIRNAIVHPSLATPILSYTPLQSSASPAPAASSASPATVGMSQVYGQSGSLEVQLHDPSFDYKSTFLAPANVSTSCATRPSGTIDPKQTSSPVGSQPFRPSPSFGSFPLLQLWPTQMEDETPGGKREVKRTGPFMRRNLALEAAEGVDKVIVLDGQQSPPSQSAARPSTVVEVLVSMDQATVAASPAASTPATDKGKGKGKSSDKVKRVKDTTAKTNPLPSKTKSRAGLTVELVSRSSRERGLTPTLHGSETAEGIGECGWTVDDKRGILESVNNNLPTTAHRPSTPPVLDSATTNSANSMTFLSPDSTPTRAEKLALRQQTRRIAELSAPLFPSPRTRRRYDDDFIRSSSPVPDLDDLDLSDTDTEEPVRKRRKGEGQKGVQQQHKKKGEDHGEDQMKRRKVLGVRSEGGQGMGKNAGAGWVGFTSSEMLTSLEDVSAPAGPPTKTPVIRASGVKKVDKKNNFRSPAPIRAYTSAASMVGDGIGDQLPGHGQPAPAQGGSGSSYHKGPVEGLRKIRSRTSASFIPPTPVRQRCGRENVASSIPVMPDGNAKTGPMPAVISNEAGTLEPGTSASVAAAPPTPEFRPTKRKRASTTIPNAEGASLRPDSSSMSKQAEAAAPAPDPTGMASPPSSPFSRPLTFDRSPSDRSLTAEDEQGSDGEVTDADAEGEEEDAVQEDSSEEQEHTEDEYQDAAEKTTRKMARDKRKARAKASGYKQPPRKGSNNQAVKKVEAGGGSTQAHTGRGYTEHELQLMLPFWDGKSVLSIGALKGAQKALTKAGYKKREPTALKWYMKNTLHARILKYAEENPPAVPLPPSTRTRSSI